VDQATTLWTTALILALTLSQVKKTGGWVTEIFSSRVAGL
jgi:hypothetical protein